jgi:hypothetical protein
MLRYRFSLMRNQIVKLRTQAEALQVVSLADVETHFNISVRQLYAVVRICEIWHHLVRVFKASPARLRNSKCRDWLEQMFDEVKKVDALMIQRADYIDPRAKDQPDWTERMTVEEVSFYCAMNSFSQGEMKWAGVT